MLETRNLCKVYKPKKGVPVKALDNVSLKFPEKGMIFLLGKSGSGKSTLLNLLGGLDKYDDGEIIIKGVSSKAFKQQYFDSYRNTYVGFIFQEYNILEEFSVGANIALAIELQGRKATDEEINNILKEVDLEGYGNRKPNELSGGQKQRVAIARALIKNPNIIMADEPTGALDSNTGKQVFDTLKKLSKDKLVIIVSHDREFSEKYADRIIELSDGRVVSDVELTHDEEVISTLTENAEGITFNGSKVEISRGYHLTEEDRLAINDYIDKIASGEVSLEVNTGKSSGARFVNTDQSKINSASDGNFKLIKSKLPFKNAFKIGASGLKYKKVKLVFTIILSVVAFTLFGLADTFGSYNHIKTCVRSLEDSNINYVSLRKAVKHGTGVNAWWSEWDTTISKANVEFIEKETGIELTGVYYPRNLDMYFMQHFNTEATFTESDMNIYAETFVGFGEITKESIENMGYELVAGKIPDGSKNEIAISKYIYETFVIGGYCDGREANEDEKITYIEVNEYEDLIGKTINLGEEKYVITGIVDTKVDLERYMELTESEEGLSSADRLLRYALMSEFSYLVDESLARVAMVGEGFVDKLLDEALPITNIGVDYASIYNDNVNIWCNFMANFKDVEADDVVITWVDGEKTTLGDKEIIVSSDCLSVNFDMGSGSYIEEDVYVEIVDPTAVDYSPLKNESLTLNIWDGNRDDYYEGYKVVGVIETMGSVEKNFDWYDSMIVSDDLYEELLNGMEVGEFEFAVGGMPQDSKGRTEIVTFANTDYDGVMYKLQNAVTYELDTVNEVLKVISKVFFGIGIGFAIFASLMLANFIGNSISYKKQEIGILRAIGSRSNDVFAIFFSESLIIAVVNFIISAIGVGTVVAIINYFMRIEAGILVTILHFGIRQILLLLVVSIGIAAIASFIPVKKIASKKPIDAIRNR